MDTSLIRQLLLALALVIGSCSTVAAAIVRNSDDKLCALKLEGDITAGDFDRFSVLISGSRISRYDERTTSVCLKSNGGSYIEGLKIAELIYNTGLSTVIEYGSECYSACAVIFMAGVASERESPMRKLSVGGILGFHAPYLMMSDEKYSKEDVENVAQGMRTAILSLVRLSSKHTLLHGGDFIKKSLISKILEKGPKEVFFVKTIYEASRWDILLYDAAQYLIKPGNIDGVRNVCSNFHSSNMDEETATEMELSLKLEKFSSKFQKDDARILVRNAKTNDTVCEIYPRTFRSDDQVKFFVCSYDYWSSRSFGDCREYLTAPAIRVGNFVPDFFSYPPTMPLLSFR